MNNRRDFIKYFFGGSAYLSLSGISTDVWAKKEVTKITILHTNDVHSHIDPFPDNDPKYPGLGGVARRASIIKEIRKQNPNTFCLMPVIFFKALHILMFIRENWNLN